MKKKSGKLKLKPSARDKRRYILVSGSVDKEHIDDIMLKYLGIFGFARAAYKLVSKSRNKIVISCLRKYLNDVKSALLLEGLNIENVSGSMKGLKK